MQPICSKKIELRKLQSTPAMESWQPLSQVKRVQVVFCKRVGDALTCSCNPVCSAVGYQPNSSQGFLNCLLEDLKFFYGENWIASLDASPPSVLRPLPIGEEYEWIPNGFDTCSLQRITPKQRRNGDVLAQPSPVILPIAPTLITFGHVVLVERSRAAPLVRVDRFISRTREILHSRE